MTSSPAEPPAPRRASLAIGLTIGLSAALLVVSLALPTVRFRAFASDSEVYSIYGGIRALWLDGNPILASIVFAFSIVFPFVKLLLLSVAWWRGGTGGYDRAVVRALELLGKWSMLDVWIIALFVGSIRIGIATAESLIGIQVFGFAILVSMVAAARMARELEVALPFAAEPRLDGLFARLLNLGAAIALATAFTAVMLTVKKAFLFSNDVGIWSGSTDLFHGGERALGAALGLLVVGATVLRTLVAAWLRWAPGPSPRTLSAGRRAALFLEEWAMVDVFALALMIVSVKLDQLATMELRVGFWATIAAAVLAAADGWLLRSDLRRERRVGAG